MLFLPAVHAFVKPPDGQFNRQQPVLCRSVQPVTSSVEFQGKKEKRKQSFYMKKKPKWCRKLLEFEFARATNSALSCTCIDSP